MVRLAAVRQATRRLLPLERIGRYRAQALVLATIIVMSSLVYTAGILLNETRYLLTDASVQLIGLANKNLAKKIKLDQSLGSYRFNAEAITPEMTGESDPAKVAALLAHQKQQTGGSGEKTENLYSLDMPIDPKKGTTVYDSDSKTSFKIIPEFDLDTGRSEDGRLVYPLQAGGQAVYTAKGNGLKEDIVLAKPRGNTLTFRYKLDLPKTLQARLDDRGNLGIYGVDPLLSAALTHSSDTARLNDIIANGTKDHLVYLIPAPSIVQSGAHPRAHQASAHYQLDHDTLTVSAEGLATLTYPISIDPSVVVTSTADFATGNNESNISFDTDAISRSATTPGTTGAWSATTSLPTQRYGMGYATYNNYAYVLGGNDGANAMTTVYYAALNSNGTFGAWTATTSLTSARYDLAAVAYNGYLYVTGGSSAAAVATVEYAPINANGTLGTWTATTSLTSARYSHGMAEYNGYMYVTGGYNTANLATVEYAPINANGTLGTWTATTSLTSARYAHGMAIYNGYVYVAGGSGSLSLSLVEYAPINADGTLGAWTTTTSLTSTRYGNVAIASNGYLYTVGGFAGGALATVEYAPINANGAIGAWTSTNSYTTGRMYAAVYSSSGSISLVGGYNGTGTVYGDAQVATFDTTMPGKTFTESAWTATTSLGLSSGSATTKALTRANHSSVAYNGYLYVIGGTLNATTGLSSVHMAPINSNGTIGAWTATTALPAVRQGAAVFIFNGYLYVAGGQDASSVFTTTVYYTTLNATTGAVSAWTTTSTLPTGVSNQSMVVYKGYLYSIGGVVTGGTTTAAVNYVVINTNGNLGAWTATTALPAARGMQQSFAFNGFLYVIGGNSGGTTATTLYAPINSNGTIGTWATTTSMNSPRSYFSGQFFQGVFIAVGGTTGSAEQNTTEYTTVNADGTLGAWTNGTSFTTARDSFGLAQYNGTLYLTGGTNGASTYYGDVQYATIDYNRTGTYASLGSPTSWSATTALSATIYGQATVTYNGYMYMIGGNVGGATASTAVQYAPINANGTIGTWSSTTAMGTARFDVAAVVYNGYLYVSGGQQSSGVVANTVEYAPINANGSIGTWTTATNTFTTGRYGHVMVVYGGRLYILCGADSLNNSLSDVQYATVAADGSVGIWATTTALSLGSTDADGFVYNGKLYLIGGIAVSNTYNLDTTRYASINTDGTLGAWQESPFRLDTGRDRLATVAYNGYVYVSGGRFLQPGNSSSPTQYIDLQYAQLNADGSLGPWRTGATISGVAGAPTSCTYQSMVATKGTLYIAGCYNGTAGSTGVYMTGANASALAATYSRVTDLGTLNTVTSVVTGSTGTAPAVWYRSAGSDGVFGAWQPVSVLTTTPATGVRYLMYKLTMDDSGTGYYFSSAAGRSTVTDVTVNYTVPTNVTPATRLRHNKYFDTSGVLQPLETP